jgi:hypothetical protein
MKWFPIVVPLNKRIIIYFAVLYTVHHAKISRFKIKLFLKFVTSLSGTAGGTTVPSPEFQRT